MDDSYDFVVIGAGSGGITAAGFAAQIGAKVAIVEKNRIGGDCTWTGCVPSKALLKVARIAHAARTAGEYGIHTTNPKTDMSAVRAYVRRAIASVYQYETPDQLRSEGIDVILGEACFLDKNTIRVGKQIVRAQKFLLVTGSHPYIPPINGIDDVPYVTHEEFFDNDHLPSRLIVLGAGPVGVEMAQAYQRLGSNVTLVDVNVLPQQDGEASRVIRKVLAREGITFVEGLASRTWMDDENIGIRVGDEHIRGDMLLVATGRRPNVFGLELESAGVAYSQDGIRVDDALRTTVKNIYAAGDCIGGLQFTHLAAWQGYQSARNALLPGREKAFKKAIPWTIFTDPELAQVGITEEAAREQYGSAIRVAHRPMHRSDRAVCENDQDGFLKIIHKPDGTILGATIVANRAGEVISEFVLAMEFGLKLSDLASTVHVYPSYNMDTMRLAAEVTVDNLVSGLSGTVVRQLTKFAWG
jgi:pyruvate/2-oxoglutarate dehydrogenase complex dihydrolipoamide dehydrogenase (E3) component